MNAFVTISAQAAELRASYDAEGMSNPISIFICPHCHQAADVEYEVPDLDFPSGMPVNGGRDPIDAARCFRCGRVSYWLMVDFDLHNNDAPDWRDFPRVLLYPIPAHPTYSCAAPLSPQAAPKEEPVALTSGITFSALSALYLAEQADQLRPSSLRDMKSACKTLATALTDSEGQELNLKEHTREHMTNLKASLMVGRKPLTVNKLLTRISTIFTWAVNSGYLEKTYNKGLKISNGAESGRKAFSPEQVKKVMSVVSELPENSWKRWAMSIGIITGARIGEVFQLTKADVRKEGDSVVIDLNETGNKSLKNKHSKRLVPLVNGAYGFDLKAFLAFVESCPEKLFDRTSHNFTRVLNETLRDILDLESGEGLTFHSLRHSLASLMKHSGVQVSIVQDILGHSSQTITFDLYGGNVSLAVGKLEAALKASFGVAAQ
jgi:integrase